MDQGQNPPENPSEKQELPQPHDMLLNPTPKSGGQLPPPTFWEKYGSKKWLLPLLIFLLVLAVAAGTYYVAGAGTSSKKANKLERQLKKNKKEKKQNKKNKKDRKNNKKKKSVAIAQPGWTTFSYGNGANTITMQYPQDMKVNITSGVSSLDNKTQATVISFTGGTNPMEMTLEPNPTNLSITAWHDQLAKQNKLYASATETTQFAGVGSLLQQTAGTTPAWNAFIPMKGTILFAHMTYTGDSKTARNDFLTILDTLQIDKTNKTKAPSVRVLPSNPAI